MVHKIHPEARIHPDLSSVRQMSVRTVTLCAMESELPSTLRYLAGETVLDLTQTAKTFDDVCGWVTRAIARELTDETRLLAAMTVRTKLRWRADLRELIVAAAGGDHSVLEFRYHRTDDNGRNCPADAPPVTTAQT
jgi:hypothetical protein